MVLLAVIPAITKTDSENSELDVVYATVDNVELMFYAERARNESMEKQFVNLTL